MCHQPELGAHRLLSGEPSALGPEPSLCLGLLESDPVHPQLRALPWFHVTQDKGQSPPCDPQGSTRSAPVASLPSSPLFLSLPLPSDRMGVLLSQGLCISCSSA